MNLTGYPSIDKPWQRYYSEEAIHAPLPEGSMYDCMTACNAGRLDEPALNYFGRKITWFMRLTVRQTLFPKLEFRAETLWRHLH